jgi:hypothetical protein
LPDRNDEHREGNRPMTSLLCVRGVKAYYGHIAALRGVDVDVG